jgi:AcrR family transcriptional regulator
MKDRSVEEKILSASTSCFERFGMRRATMEDIAQSAGVSRKTVYRYFATKNELIAAVIEREALDVVESALTRLTLTHPSDVLVATAEFTLLQEAMASPRYHLFVDPDQALPTLDLLVRHQSRVRILGRYWTPVLDELDRRKALRTDVPRSELFQWIMFVHLTLLTSSGRIGIGGEQVTVETLRRYLGPSVVAAAELTEATSLSAE